MADLIDRQAALEAFEWADADVCEADEFGSSWGFGHKNIKDVLNKLPTIDPESLRPKWISVEDRLPQFSPKKWRKVLVTIEDERGVRFTSTAKYDERYQRWYEFSRPRFFNEDKFRVVAWMERPAPYCGDDARGEANGK